MRPESKERVRKTRSISRTKLSVPGNGSNARRGSSGGRCRVGRSEDRPAHGAEGEAQRKRKGVYRVTFPRADVKVAVDGWTMPPFMGLGTWAAFTAGSPTEAMVMGDTVLFEDEVNAAISCALDNGLSVTALHNHFFFDKPKVYFMHIEGQGTTEQLGTAVRKLYDRIKKGDSRHRQSAAKGFFRRRFVAGEERNFGGTVKHDLRHERRSKQRDGEIYDGPPGVDARSQDRQRHGRQHVGRVCRRSDENAGESMAISQSRKMNSNQRSRLCEQPGCATSWPSTGI